MTRLAQVTGRLIRRLVSPLGIVFPPLGRWMQRRGPCHNGPPYVTTERLSAGLVLILPGIEGPSLYISGLRDGLMDGGLEQALVIHNWAGERLGASYAFDQASARARAGELVEEILRYRADYPGRPVFLVGMSGGAAMVVLAAEAAGTAGLTVDGVVSLAPPLSPGYDLSAALSAVRTELVVFHSSRDVELLTLTTLGTNFDGVRGRPAGQVGFETPGESDERRAAYRRLRQIAWDESMKDAGHRGDHADWTRRTWVRRYLAPIISGWIGSAVPSS